MTRALWVRLPITFDIDTDARGDNFSPGYGGFAVMLLNYIKKEYLPVIALGLLAPLTFTSSVVAQVPTQQASSPSGSTVSSIDHTFTLISAEQSYPTPMQNYRGLLLLRVKINGHDGWAMLDNACTQTLFDLSFAKAAGLKIGPVVTSIDLGPASSPARLIEGTRVDVPGQMILSGMGLTMDLASFSKTVGHKIDLIIGGDYLDKMSILVASSNNTLIFALSGGITPKGRAAIIPLKSGTRLDAEVNDRPVSLMVDLGFNGVVRLTRSSWDRVIPTGTLTKRGDTSSMDGILRPTQSVSNATLKVGKISADGVGVAVGERIVTSGDGIIGTGFLTKFDFILDVGASRLVAIPFG